MKPFHENLLIYLTSFFSDLFWCWLCLPLLCWCGHFKEFSESFSDPNSKLTKSFRSEFLIKTKFLTAICQQLILVFVKYPSALATCHSSRSYKCTPSNSVWVFCTSKLETNFFLVFDFQIKKSLNLSILVWMIE